MFPLGLKARPTALFAQKSFYLFLTIHQILIFKNNEYYSK